MGLRRALLPVLFFVLAGSHPSAGQNLELELVEVASGLTKPITLANAGDGSGRLFIGQQTGEILILDQGAVLPTPFLDLSSLVSGGSEQGLLGIAFHPAYASKGIFYVHYTDDEGDTVVARYEVSEGNPNVADPDSVMTILTEVQPAQNHNGGQLAFGPDGYLYIALGDGGGSGDPNENAQDLDSLLGKVLRIDVNGDDFADPNRNYVIPGDNPFVGVAERDEIWAYGLRNPWRFSFDRLTGDLWIGDVGQNAWEEVDFQPASSLGGENYGWDVLEGGLQPGTPGPDHPNCYTDDPKRDDDCDDFLTGASTLPVLEYANDASNCAVTGGFRSRGLADPRLFGTYLYADYCSGTIWGALPDCDDGFTSRILHEADDNLPAFGEGEEGELYVTQYRFTAGLSSVHRVIVDPASGGPNLTPTPSSINFGNHPVGGNTTVGLTLENTGTGGDNLVVEFLTLTDDVNFGLELDPGPNSCGDAPLCLATGDDCMLEVTFQPQREGGFDELLLLPANSVPAAVALQGIVPCTGPHGPDLSNNTITTSAVYTDCHEVIVGPDLTVSPSGRLEVRAGESIAIVPPFSVEAGGGLELVLDPVLAE